MGWLDFLVLAVVILIIAGAIFLMYRAKKSGKKCIGCPESGHCSQGNCQSGCSCSHTDSKD